MFDGLLSAIGDFFSSDTAGNLLSAAAPAAIAAYAGGQASSANADLAQQKLLIDQQEAQKDRDLRLLLAKLTGGGGGGSGAATLGAKGAILNNVVEQLINQAKIKSDAINEGTKNTVAPLMNRYSNPRVA